MLVPAFIFYQTQKSALDKTAEQLASQLIRSLRASVSKPLMLNDNFLTWQLINTYLKNNQLQIESNSLFKINEIAILNNNNLVFAHSAPRSHALQKPYAGVIENDLLLDSTAEAIYGIDINGNCTFVNKACLKILGYDKKSALIDKNMFQLLHNGNRTSSINNSIILEEKIHLDNKMIWKKDNSCFPVEYWSHPIFINHACIGAVVTFLDIPSTL